MSSMPKHFLLVEDDRMHAELITLAVMYCQGTTTIDRVSDGHEALAYLRQEGCYRGRPRPDVILLDLYLPKMNGHDVLQAIKEDPELEDIPVVVLSSSNEKADVEKAYRLRANSFLVKPTRLTDFCKMVDTLRVYWSQYNQVSLGV